MTYVTMDSRELVEAADFASGDAEMQLRSMDMDHDLVLGANGYRCDVAHHGELVAMEWGATPERAVARGLDEAVAWASKHGWLQ